MISTQEQKHLKSFVQSSLLPEERIIAEHLSGTRNSYYVTIFRAPNQSSVIRFSNHLPVKSYQRFVKIQFPNEQLEKYRTLLQSAHRLKINYSSYFVLKIVVLLKQHKINLQVDDSYGTFKEETLPPIFVAFSNPRGTRKEVIHLEEVTTNILVKLYRYGFIDILHPQFGSTEVYVTRSGMAVLKELDKRYLPYWESDAPFIKWHILKLPKFVLVNSQNLAEVENRERQKYRQRLIFNQKPWYKKLIYKLCLWITKKDFAKLSEEFVLPAPATPKNFQGGNNSQDRHSQLKREKVSKKISSREDKESSKRQMERSLEKRSQMGLSSDLQNMLSQFKETIEE